MSKIKQIFEILDEIDRLEESKPYHDCAFTSEPTSYINRRVEINKQIEVLQEELNSLRP